MHSFGSVPRQDHWQAARVSLSQPPSAPPHLGHGHNLDAKPEEREPRRHARGECVLVQGPDPAALVRRHILAVQKRKAKVVPCAKLTWRVL